MIQQFIILSSLYMTALSQNPSDTDHSLYNQPEFISGIIDTMNEFRSVKNLQWDQEIANCAFVTACLRYNHNFLPKDAHSFSMGMRPCHSYTCGGVTCKKTASSQGAFQFDIRDKDGFKKPIRDIVAHPDGGHEKPIQSLNTTRIGCGTHIADRVRAYNAHLYCDYSQNPDCKDENCCNQFYKTQLKECKAAVYAKETYYLRSQVCESYPNGDHLIAGNSASMVSSASNPATVVKPTTTTLVASSIASNTDLTSSLVNPESSFQQSPTTVQETMVPTTAFLPSGYPSNHDDTVFITSGGLHIVSGLISFLVLLLRLI